MCLNAGGMGRIDAESETLLPVTHSLRGEGFDASEDGTGRGTPLVPVAFAIQAGALRTNPLSGPDGVGVQADHAYTIEARAEVQAVAFNWNAQPAQPPGPDRDTSVNDGLTCSQQAAVAFAQNQLGEVRSGDVFNTLNTNSNASGRNTPLLSSFMQVRRLTPRECERLQGFPDDYTLIPWRRKPPEECPDGPRYKALGNSWAVPCVRWIGRRLARHLEALA